MEKRYPAYRVKFPAVTYSIEHQLNWKVADTTESYPAKRESCVHAYGKNIIPVTEISPVNKRDLGTRENFSSHMNAM
jgi:hypothetical protein